MDMIKLHTGDKVHEIQSSSGTGGKSHQLEVLYRMATAMSCDSITSDWFTIYLLDDLPDKIKFRIYYTTIEGRCIIENVYGCDQVDLIIHACKMGEKIGAVQCEAIVYNSYKQSQEVFVIKLKSCECWSTITTKGELQ